MQTEDGFIDDISNPEALGHCLPSSPQQALPVEDGGGEATTASSRKHPLRCSLYLESLLGGSSSNCVTLTKQLGLSDLSFRQRDTIILCTCVLYVSDSASHPQLELQEISKTWKAL